MLKYTAHAEPGRSMNALRRAQGERLISADAEGQRARSINPFILSQVEGCRIYLFVLRQACPEPSRRMNALRRAGERFISADAELVEARRFRTVPSASSGQARRSMNNLNNAASFDKAQDERLSIGFPFTLSQVEVSGHAEPSRSTTHLKYPQFAALPKRVFSWFQT